MSLSDAEVERFRELYKSECLQSLTDAEAREQATKLLSLLKAVYAPETDPLDPVQMT